VPVSCQSLISRLNVAMRFSIAVQRRPAEELSRCGARGIARSV